MRNKIVVLLVLISTFCSVYAQNDELINCDTNIVVGQNLIVNGGFEDGDVGFRVPNYISWNTDNPGLGYSRPGEYWVHNIPSEFNKGIPEEGIPPFIGTPKDEKFLMIDGKCDPDIKNIVWEQDVFIAKDTRYFFRAFIVSLKSDINSARLRFEIGDSVLAEPIVAPTTAGVWTNAVDSSWYSGNLSGLITIRIINDQTIGCETANDFALDDISFSAGCFFGAEGEIPELGPNQTLCGTTDGKIDIAPMIPSGNDYEFLWSTGSKDSSITITTPGVYAVCMKTSGSCVKSDKIRITDKFDVDLGPDKEICSPAVATLDPSYYKGSRYSWYKDGALLGGLQNQKIVSVNEVGTYIVEVIDLVCEPEKDTINITSSTIRAVNANFCPADGDSVQLSISNTPSAPENYIWYADEALTVQVGTGLTFTTPDTLTQTTSYYVKDQSIFQGAAGPLVTANTSNNNPFGDSQSDKYIAFDLANDIILDSVLVFPMYNQNFSVGFAVYDRNTNALVTSKVVPVSLAGNPGSDNLQFPTYIPLDLAIPAGQYYVKNTGTTGQLHYNQGQWTPTFPYKDTDGILSIIGLSPSEQWQAALYGYFYDWHFSTGTVCDPVEVKAVYDPIACAGCTPPVLANTPLNVGVSCNSGPVTLRAEVIDGTNNGSWNYLWTKNGDTLLTAIGDSIVVAFPDSGTYTVTVTDNDAPDVCFETRVFRVDLTSPPDPIVDIEIRLDEAICLVGEVSTFAIDTNFTPTPTVFQWFRNDTLQTTTSDNITISLKDGDELKVAVTGLDGCGNNVTASDSVTVQGLEEITPTIDLSAISSCQDELVTVEATIAPASAAINASYTWSINTTTQTTNADTLQKTFVDGDSVSVVATIVADGCYTTNTISASSKAQIFTALIPEVYISADKNDVCENELPIVFSVDSLKNGGVPTYQWFVNDSEQPGETGVTFEPTSLDSGDVVKVEMTSSLSCVTTSIAADSVDNIIINALVDVSVRLSDVPLSSCAGDSIELEAMVDSDTVTGSYQWKLNGNDVGTDSNKYKSAFDDQDVVTVEFTPAIACPAADTVQAANPATISITTPSVTLGSINSGIWCDGKTNGFEVINSTLGGNTPLFEWRINSNPILEPETGDSIVRTTFQTGDTIKVEMITSAPNEACTNPTDFAVVGTFESPEDVTIGLSSLTFCDEETIEIIAGGENHGGLAKYTWEINSVLLPDTVSSISPNSVTDGDLISVSVLSSETCVNFDTASTQGVVTLIPTPDVVLAADEILLSDYEEVTLDANKSELSGATYSWSSSDTTLYDLMTGRFSTVAKVTPKQTLTKFYFNASRTENGTTCSDADSILVIVDYSFELPNAFSPNGDGLNDLFQIDNLEKLDAFRLQIFNRWGTLLYEQKGLSDFWDGTYNGSPVPVATYYYVFEYELDGEKQEPKKDFISLIR